MLSEGGREVGCLSRSGLFTEQSVGRISDLHNRTIILLCIAGQAHHHCSAVGRTIRRSLLYSNFCSVWRRWHTGACCYASDKNRFWKAKNLSTPVFPVLTSFVYPWWGCNSSLTVFYTVWNDKYIKNTGLESIYPCQCGVLFCALRGLSGERKTRSFRSTVPRKHQTWRAESNTGCTI